jgi:hypothetical protein
MTAACSTAHERKRRNFDFAGLQGALDNAGVHQVIERVVNRAQIGIDLLAHIAGKETQSLAGLNSRS